MPEFSASHQHETLAGSCSSNVCNRTMDGITAAEARAGDVPGIKTTRQDRSLLKAMRPPDRRAISTATSALFSPNLTAGRDGNRRSPPVPSCEGDRRTKVTGMNSTRREYAYEIAVEFR